MGNTSYALDGYQWLIGVGILGAMAFNFGTGSNDVANAFATSVGSRTLTMKQAVMIAAVFEFCGGMILGRVTTNVIASGIVDTSYFADSAEFYAYGMACSMGVGAIWQLFASYKGYNVSATHTIIGCIIGFGLVYGGSDAIMWSEKDPKNFPPYKGVVTIALAWVFSPILTGTASAIIFWLCRTLVLRAEEANSIKRAYMILPFAVFLTTWVNAYFTLTKGAAKELQKKNPNWDNHDSAMTALGVAAGFAIISICFIPYLMKVAARDDRNERDITDLNSTTKMSKLAKMEANNNDNELSAPAETVSSAVVGDEDGMEGKKRENVFAKMYHASAKQLDKGLNYDIHAIVKTDPLISQIHQNAEKFHPKTEVIFSYLQVFSAICVSFSHGANETGYAAGPLNGIYHAVKNDNLPSKIQPKTWILLISVLSLVLGLATYGYNVTRAMGTQMAKLTPSRGFAAELSTAMTIMVAAQYGMPTSSSQCITGGIIGVGLLEGTNGLNWMFICEQVGSWMMTLVVAGAGTAALFSQGVYAPSKLCKYECQDNVVTSSAP